MVRLAIISSHPIQYNAPWFAKLSVTRDFEIFVFYTWQQRQQDFRDKNFGKEIIWDIPLLEGYKYRFIENPAQDPGNHHFKGITCPTLIEEILSWQPTHLLVFGWNFKAHLKVIRHFKKKIPILFRGDSTLLDEKPGIKRVLRRIMLQWVYQFIDYALYTGESNKKYFQKHGLKEIQLVHAPHAIDNMRFFENQNLHLEQAAGLRQKYNIGIREKVILFVGKFDTIKEPLLLIEAFKLLELNQKAAENLRLVFVGNGELENKMRQEATDHPSIRFMPFQNQSMMPAIYRMGDILCLPSRSETWGLVVNESMASGTPCLISSQAGCAADLGKYEGNLIFESGNAKDLALKLNIMLEENSFDNQQFLQVWNFTGIIHGVKEATNISQAED